VSTGQQSPPLSAAAAAAAVASNLTLNSAKEIEVENIGAKYQIQMRKQPSPSIMHGSDAAVP
jgi:hypothetical protein